MRGRSTVVTLIAAPAFQPRVVVPAFQQGSRSACLPGLDQLVQVLDRPSRADLPDSIVARQLQRRGFFFPRILAPSLTTKSGHCGNLVAGRMQACQPLHAANSGTRRRVMMIRLSDDSDRFDGFDGRVCGLCTDRPPPGAGGKSQPRPHQSWRLEAAAWARPPAAAGPAAAQDAKLFCVNFQSPTAPIVPFVQFVQHCTVYCCRVWKLYWLSTSLRVWV